MNKRNILIIISFLVFILIVGGVSYSYFVYNKDVGDVSLSAGEISIDLSGVSGNQTLTNVIPLSDYDGMNSSDYFDFTVNAIVDTEKIYYEVYILPDSNNTLDTSYLKTYLTDQSNNEINGVFIYNDLGDSEKENAKVIYKGLIELNNNGTTRNESKDFRLRLWLDENYSEQTAKTFDFDIYLYAKNVDADFELPYGSNLLRKALEEKEAQGGTCANITYEEDGITYLSGTNDCIDMNYVWYSGKLWRITEIYPDGAMKLVTQNNITSISFNPAGEVNFYTDANTTSYMYQWLNEEFNDTLYNANQMIDTTKEWNATRTIQYVTVEEKPLETNMVTANVGLLNNYEYYNSYRCIGQSTACNNMNYQTQKLSYLVNGYYWWLLNPCVDNAVWGIKDDGAINASGLPVNGFGVRPSIVIKSGIEFTGSGTSSNPYKIVGDKGIGNTNELINTRLSGEYVKLSNGAANQVFRIIGVEENKTKIIAMDYAENGNTRQFATNTSNLLWGSGTTTAADTWYTYLNDNTNGYLKSLKTSYGELFDSGMYYLGKSGMNYKLAVCTNTTRGRTKVCNKTSNKGIFNIGLPRYGEMFATQQIIDNSTPINIWLMNNYNNSSSIFVSNIGLGTDKAPSDSCGARPTVHLKSTVKILSGTGTESDPYVVGL